MRILIALFAFALSASAWSSTNITIVVVGTNGNMAVRAPIFVPTNKIGKVVFLSHEAPGGSFMSVDIGSSLVSVSSNIVFGARPVTVAGPATIYPQSISGLSTLCTVEISSNEEVYQTPSGAVVIPADSSGPVDIILESSEDMVTWTAASPGTYGASTAKRFFRVRAVASQ